MAILNFQKPDKIVLQKVTDFEAQFEFRPLEPGYGVTIGNALRRVLLKQVADDPDKTAEHEPEEDVASALELMPQRRGT